MVTTTTARFGSVRNFLLGAIATTMMACAFAFAPLAAPLAGSPINLVNPGFEEPGEALGVPPNGWSKAGDGAAFSLDTGTRSSGKNSLKLERPEGVRMTALSQSLDASGLIGKILVVRAKFKSDGLTPGANGLMLVARSADQKTVGFAASDALSLVGTTNWSTRVATIVVPDTATQISVGVRMVSVGTLWVDDVETSIREIDGTARMDDATRNYLDDAIEKVQRDAMNSDKVDWPRVRAQAYALAQDAANAADTHDAIRFVLRSLRDGHSYFIAPNTAKQTQANSNAEKFDLASATIAGKGYVSVPGYTGNLSARQTGFVDAIQTNIKARAADNVCGWIVDLRENTGGSMHPMLAGLAPLFGDGALGLLVSPKGNKPWRIANGGSGFGEAADGSNDARATRPLILNGAIAAPVAVLLGPKTASSGEIVAVSFVGRPNTRSFGEPTRGQTTGNSSIELTDGAVMAVTTSIYADRNGKRYGGKVIPDEPVRSVSGAATRIQDDALIDAAIKWLDDQRACHK